MSSRKHIQSELNQLNSSLPFDVNEPVFDVPQGYFENFASGVLAKIKGELAVSPKEELEALSPLLAGLSKQMPYTVPDNYFSETAASLPPLVREEPLPGVLAQAGKRMPYELPPDYFEQLPQQVLAQVAPPKTKVVPLFARRWVQYAAAAVVMGALALGSILYLQSSPADPVTEPEVWVAKKLRDVSNQELDEFLNEASANGLEASRRSSDKPEARKLLQDVSTSELDAFLSQVPAENDNIILIN